MRRFEEFKLRNVPGAAVSEPRASITTRGYIGINRAAVDALGNPERVVLLFDKESKMVGLKPATKDVEHSYPIRRVRNSTSYNISAASFCNYYGIDVSQTRVFEPKLEGKILVFSLDEGKVALSSQRGKPKKSAAKGKSKKS